MTDKYCVIARTWHVEDCYLLEQNTVDFALDYNTAVNNASYYDYDHSNDVERYAEEWYGTVRCSPYTHEVYQCGLSEFCNSSMIEGKGDLADGQEPLSV
jgi:hypothetical protein